MRFAIYYAPAPGSPLHDLGSRWLGRDAFTGQSLVPPEGALPGDTTAEPRRYGLHATLKPPFALAAHASPAQLSAAVLRLARGRGPVVTGLVLAEIDGFLALVPSGEGAALRAIADACVRDLDGFRLAPSLEELDRRRRAGLTTAQNDYLAAWGYPYVFDEFRFHMTLTGRLDETRLAQARALARRHFAAVLEATVAVDALCVFTEPSPGAPFIARERFPLGAAAAGRP